jgi:hypothetical protein
MSALASSNKVTLNFSKIKYTIKAIDYDYRNSTEPVFYTYASVVVPKNDFPDTLRIGLPLEKTMEHVEKNNSGMAKYVRKVIEGYDDQPKSELLAFQSLEDDGFDLTQFMGYMLQELSIEIEKHEAQK